jgi:hypothetical protein
MGDVKTPLDRLAPYIPEPTLAKPALEWILAAERPALLREVAAGIGVKPSDLTAVLPRLARKGLIRRWKQQFVVAHPCFPGQAGRTSRRMLWLYAAPEPGE